MWSQHSVQSISLFISLSLYRSICHSVYRIIIYTDKKHNGSHPEWSSFVHSFQHIPTNCASINRLVKRLEYRIRKLKNDSNLTSVKVYRRKQSKLTDKSETISVSSLLWLRWIEALDLLWLSRGVKGEEEETQRQEELFLLGNISRL